LKVSGIGFSKLFLYIVFLPILNYLEEEILPTRSYTEDELELDVGDPCTLHSGEKSICKEKTNCSTLSEKNIVNNLCSDDEELVCCPPEDDKLNCRKNSITKKLEQSWL
jgi:hypothetical protein